MTNIPNQWGLGGGLGSRNYERNIRDSGKADPLFQRTFTPEWGSPFSPKAGIGGFNAGPFDGLTRIQGESRIARDLLANKDPALGRSYFYNKGYGGGKAEMLHEGDWQQAVAGARLEKQFLEAEAQKEKAYDAAASSVEAAKGLIERSTKRVPGSVQEEVIGAQSAAQIGIAGGSKAGRTLEGEFKTDYESGSILPASWMRNELDTEKIAQQKSGLTDRTGPAKLSFGGKEYSFARSAPLSPYASSGTGLGK